MLKSQITKELFVGFIVITAIVSLVLSIIALTKKCYNSKETFNDDNLPTCQGQLIRLKNDSGVCNIDSKHTNCEQSYVQYDDDKFQQCICMNDKKKDSCNYDKSHMDFCIPSINCKPPN